MLYKNIMQGYQIEHLCSECKLRAMIVPYGLRKNTWVLNMKPGDEMYTIDEKPVLIQVLEKMVMPVMSPTANCLSLLIYGKPIETVFKAMFQNWGYDIQRRFVILIIYKVKEQND